MQDLIERLEAATGADRELDALIECELRKQQAYALGLTDEQRSHWTPYDLKGEVIDHQKFCRYHSPTYSFSIDAALKLVPEGWCWMAGHRNYPKSRAYVNNGELMMSGKCKWFETVAATPALALCISALKARVTVLGRNGAGHG